MKSQKNIVNIINFLRGWSPDSDIVKPVREDIRILGSLGLKSTFLLEYDVFNNPEIMEQVRTAGPLFEIGCWFEIVQPLVEDAGLSWRGGAPWDSAANIAFALGYTVQERKKLADTYMKRFHEEFGYYPEVVGAWMLDGILLEYLEEKYNIIAACICRDQYGTDGYNLWGGYYSQAYYPAKKNMLCPAQTATEQINIPLFRMLGPDPVRQYDCGLIDERGKVKPSDWQGVITMEPAYPKYGGNPVWVDWFLRENFSGKALGFSYVQIGQENSFQWEKVGEGLEYQYPEVAKLQSEGKLTVEHLSESGRWFRENFKTSPVCSLPFESDWRGKGAKSYWFYSRFYRINCYFENGYMRMRDLQKFDENYADRYYNAPGLSHSCLYDDLPIMDGYKFSKEDFCAAGRLFRGNNEIRIDNVSEFTDRENNIMSIIAKTGNGEIKIICSEDGIEITADECEIELRLDGALENFKDAAVGSDCRRLMLTHNGYGYSLELEKGRFSTENEIGILSEDKAIKINFCDKK